MSDTTKANGEYVTKDSGERETFVTGMQRDAGKKDLRPDLLPGPMLVRWAELMGRGAAKYSARNWEKAATQEELNRFLEGAFRHFVQWFYGLDTEEDHAAAVFFNIAGAEHVKAKLKEEKPTVGKPGLAVGVTVRVSPTSAIRKGQHGIIIDCEEESPGEFLVQFEDAVFLWMPPAELEPLP